MSFRHIYDPIALLEYKNAAAWYAERSETAATNFVKEVKGKIAVICKDPFRYRNTHKKYRETSLKNILIQLFTLWMRLLKQSLSHLFIITKEIPGRNTENNPSLPLLMKKTPTAVQ